MAIHFKNWSFILGAWFALLPVAARSESLPSSKNSLKMVNDVGHEDGLMGIDPQNPASCSIQTKEEYDCTNCCDESFIDGSDQLNSCHKSCLKAAAARNEH